MVGPIVDQTNCRQGFGVESTQIGSVATTSSTNHHPPDTWLARRSSGHKSNTPELPGPRHRVWLRGEHRPIHVEWNHRRTRRHRTTWLRPPLYGANHSPRTCACIETHHPDFGTREHSEPHCQSPAWEYGFPHYERFAAP